VADAGSLSMTAQQSVNQSKQICTVLLVASESYPPNGARKGIWLLIWSTNQHLLVDSVYWS